VEAGTQSAVEAYFAKAKSRLDAAGYEWLTAPGFRAVATRKSFQATKFGMWETFFVFRDYPHVDLDTLGAFMRDAVAYTFGNRRVGLPRGLGAGMTTYGVSLGSTVDAATAQSVRNEAPPKHWAATEVPVVYEASTNRLHYFERTPMWGAAYYRGFRKQINELLAP
jgi:hypothetical protein